MKIQKKIENRPNKWEKILKSIKKGEKNVCKRRKLPEKWQNLVTE